MFTGFVFFPHTPEMKPPKRVTSKLSYKDQRYSMWPFTVKMCWKVMHWLNIIGSYQTPTTKPQVVNWLKISDRANFGAHSRTGFEFLGSNYNSILQSSFAFNCTPISSKLSKLVHSKTWYFTLTQPFHRDFWLPVGSLDNVSVINC